MTKPLHLTRLRPGFYSYASDFIADETYAMASASERGVLFSMLNYCWVNDSVAADKTVMAKVLGLSAAEVSVVDGLLIRKHFRTSPEDSSRLVCPEVIRQRAEDAAYRQKATEGGRKGGLRTQQKNRENTSSPPSSQASSLAKAPEKRREEEKRSALSKEKSLSQEESKELPDSGKHASWVAAYNSENEIEHSH